jgi:tetratricopeptide (TPR) repeat protein
LSDNNYIDFAKNGDSDLHEGKYEEAISWYNKAIETNNENGAFWLKKGLALLSLSRFDEAIVSLDKTLSLGEDRDYALILKGSAFGQLGQYQEALICFEEAIKISPDSIIAWHGKGLTLKNIKKRYPDTWEEYTNSENHTIKEASSFLCHFKKIVKVAKL